MTTCPRQIRLKKLGLVKKRWVRVKKISMLIEDSNILTVECIIIGIKNESILGIQ